MKRKMLLFLGLNLAAMLVITACGGKAAGGASESGGNTYRVSIANMSMPVLNVAKEKGWLEEEFAKIGATVEFNNFTSGPPINEGIASKRIDLGVLGEGAVLGGFNNNLDIQLISLHSPGVKGLNYILVPKDSDIHTIGDLKGKQISVMLGTSLHVFLTKVLSKEGLSLSDVKLVNLSITDAQPAFQAGKLDAWVTTDPIASQEIHANGAIVIASGEQYQIAAPMFLFVRGEFAKEHPEAVEAFLRAVDKAVRFQNENYEQFRDVVAQISGLDPARVDLTLRNGEYQNSPITEDLLEQFQESADILQELGYIKNRVDVRSFVNSEFIGKINH